MEDGKAYKMNLELIKKARIEKGDSLQKMVNLTALSILNRKKFRSLRIF